MKSVAFVGRTLALFLCLLILPLGLRAQVVRVEVPQTVVQGASFQLSYTYSGVRTSSVSRSLRSQPAGPLWPARQQMSSFQSVNGRNSSTSSVSLTYTLMAERTGSITIPAATATIGGKRVNVHGATVRVLPPDKEMLQQGRSQSGGATTTGSYFFRALPGATVVYEKQAFPIRYKLYATTEFDINSFEAPPI